LKGFYKKGKKSSFKKRPREEGQRVGEGGKGQKGLGREGMGQKEGKPLL